MYKTKLHSFIYREVWGKVGFLDRLRSHKDKLIMAEFVDKTIDSHKVVMFSKSDCEVNILSRWVILQMHPIIEFVPLTMNSIARKRRSCSTTIASTTWKWRWWELESSSATLVASACTVEACDVVASRWRNERAGQTVEHSFCWLALLSWSACWRGSAGSWLLREARRRSVRRLTGHHCRFLELLTCWFLSLEISFRLISLSFGFCSGELKKCSLFFLVF